MYVELTNGKRINKRIADEIFGRIQKLAAKQGHIRGTKALWFLAKLWTGRIPRINSPDMIDLLHEHGFVPKIKGRKTVKLKDLAQDEVTRDIVVLSVVPHSDKVVCPYKNVPS